MHVRVLRLTHAPLREFGCGQFRSELEIGWRELLLLSEEVSTLLDRGASHLRRATACNLADRLAGAQPRPFGNARSHEDGTGGLPNCSLLDNGGKACVCRSRWSMALGPQRRGEIL